MKRSEAIFSILVVLFLFGLFIYSKWRNKFIESNSVYVISKVYRISDAENGFDYFFSYNYESKEYRSVIRSLYIEMQDSLIVLKISRDSPELWKRENGRLPRCLLKSRGFLEKSWNNFPNCPQPNSEMN